MAGGVKQDTTLFDFKIAAKKFCGVNHSDFSMLYNTLSFLYQHFRFRSIDVANHSMMLFLYSDI